MLSTITQGGLRLGERVVSRLAGRSPVLGQQVHEAPSEQLAVDIFKGRWACELPPPYSHLRAGSVTAHDDKRARWAIDRLGALATTDVLELGPLEAGHTWMLDRAGARSITAVESNQLAYLKCLLVKELVGLPRASFILGDCMPYLNAAGRRYDLCFASGIFYHMENPPALIEGIARVTDRVFLWTHYHSRAMQGLPRFRNRDFGGEDAEHAGFRYRRHRVWYGRALLGKSFWGGTHSHAHWLPREDVLACLRHFGFTKIEIGPEEIMGPNGPHFALLASKS